MHLFRPGTTLAHHETPLIAELSLKYLRHPGVRFGRLDVQQWRVENTLRVVVDQQPVTLVLRGGKELARVPAQPATGWIPPAKATKVKNAKELTKKGVTVVNTSGQHQWSTPGKQPLYTHRPLGIFFVFACCAHHFYTGRPGGSAEAG